MALNAQLEKKVQQSIRLLRALCDPDGDPVEIAYSGGKDSDVILQLAKEAGIKYRAVYKMTTVDPPGTLSHVKDMEVEILRPPLSFFQLIEKKGFPSRYRRFCCEKLKEYKVMDKAVIGVRREESAKRAERYQEPTKCRYYGKAHVEQIYPILDWTTDDVAQFLQDRHIKVAAVYYDEAGVFHPERRLGCMCCPLASRRKRILEFKQYPNMIKAYCRAGNKYMETHRESRLAKKYGDVYSWFYSDLFLDNDAQYQLASNTLFGKPNFKKMIEDYFGVELPSFEK